MSRRVAPIAILLLVALGLRLALATLFRFDGLYGQDPFAYFRYAGELRAALRARASIPPFFWPLGFPLLLAGAFSLLGEAPWVGQGVSMLAGALVAPLVYAIVLRIDAEATRGALVAGLLTAVAAQLMISSLAIMSDASALFWSLLAVWAMLGYTRHYGRHWLGLAALALGAAVITRWAVAVLVVPLGLTAADAWRRHGVGGARVAADAFLAVALGGALVGGQLYLGAAGGDGEFVGNLQIFTWNPANIFRRAVDTFDGAFVYPRPMALFYARPFFHPAFIFPLFTPFILAGLWALRAAGRSARVLMLSWPLTTYLFLIGLPLQNPRFALALFAPLAILVGLGVAQVAGRLHCARPAAATLLWAGCAAALLGSLAWTARDVGRFTAIKNAQLTAVQWVDGQIPPDATLITFGVTLTAEHYTAMTVHDIYVLDETHLQTLSEDASPLYLFLDLDNVARQWTGFSPAYNLGWLERHTVLTPVDTYAMGPGQTYTLFAIVEGADQVKP